MSLSVFSKADFDIMSTTKKCLAEFEKCPLNKDFGVFLKKLKICIAWGRQFTERTRICSLRLRREGFGKTKHLLLKDFKEERKLSLWGSISASGTNEVRNMQARKDKIKALRSDRGDFLLGLCLSNLTVRILNMVTTKMLIKKTYGNMLAKSEFVLFKGWGARLWTEVDPPPNAKIVRSKWIFKKKTDMDGKVHTYKARLVAKGCTQTYGVDYRGGLLAMTLKMIGSLRRVMVFVVNGGAVNWKSQKAMTPLQCCNAKLSTCMSDAAMETVGLEKFLRILRMPSRNKPINMFCGQFCCNPFANELES
ncbi:retrotransposon protein, putative, ty1-copia subclass [Tanacetum coccineum]